MRALQHWRWAFYIVIAIVLPIREESGREVISDSYSKAIFSPVSLGIWEDVVIFYPAIYKKISVTAYDGENRGRRYRDFASIYLRLAIDYCRVLATILRISVDKFLIILDQQHFSFESHFQIFSPALTSVGDDNRETHSNEAAIMVKNGAGLGPYDYYARGKSCLHDLGLSECGCCGSAGFGSRCLHVIRVSDRRSPELAGGPPQSASEGDERQRLQDNPKIVMSLNHASDESESVAGALFVFGVIVIVTFVVIVEWRIRQPQRGNRQYKNKKTR